MGALAFDRVVHMSEQEEQGAKHIVAITAAAGGACISHVTVGADSANLSDWEAGLQVVEDMTRDC